MSAEIFAAYCGKWGFFGYDVMLMKGRTGRWFCAEHQPADEAGLEPLLRSPTPNTSSPVESAAGRATPACRARSAPARSLARAEDHSETHLHVSHRVNRPHGRPGYSQPRNQRLAVLASASPMWSVVTHRASSVRTRECKITTEGGDHANRCSEWGREYPERSSV
jgi:hypothetical protein